MLTVCVCLSVVDKSVVYEIIDYLDKHPEVLKVDGYFDCELVKYYKLLIYLCCILFLYVVFFYMAAMNTVQYVDSTHTHTCTCTLHTCAHALHTHTHTHTHTHFTHTHTHTQYAYGQEFT